ncbi:MAG: hypothetical protein BYD32DRAFT_412969 [Podila humilis]|nr:MAG: hypothetical protein BYD32DRAFT_412969 [Podila humilis]
MAMATFPRAKVDSCTQTDPPLPFTALLDRALDRVEANVPLNLSSVTFYIRRHHLSRIERLEALLSNNFVFKLGLFRLGLKPQHVFSALCLIVLYLCRRLYQRSVYLTTNLCAVAYPAYCSIKTINSEPISPPKGLGLEPAEYGPYRNSQFSNSQGHLSDSSYRRHSRMSSFGVNSRRNSRRMNKKRLSRISMDESNNSYSSGQEEDEEDDEEDDGNSSRRSFASSTWDRPSEYSVYSEDAFTSGASGSGSMTVEERMRQRMRRRWALFSRSRKEKATRQWLAYWSIYGTVQVIDTWSSFLLDWIPGYNLGKLLFLWWAQRRGATLVFDYFQPLIQAKSKDGREVARKPSQRSLDESESSHHGGGGPSGGAGHSGGGEGGGHSGGGRRGRSRPSSMQILPSALAQQQQQLHHQYQQQQPQCQQQLYEQQFYAERSSSRRETATFHQLSQQQRNRRGTYEDSDDDYVQHGHSHHSNPSQDHRVLQRELMTASPHHESHMFDSAESVWSAPPSTANALAAIENRGGRSPSFSHSSATPTPMLLQEVQRGMSSTMAKQREQQIAATVTKLSSGSTGVIPENLTSYAAASTIHWSPPLPSDSLDD